jgi:glycosyltransferase involved in cell wall biosynthesis
LRVLVVNDYASSFGGAEVLSRRLRDGLRARGHEARLFATDLRSERGDNFADETCRGTTSGLRTGLQSWNPWARARLREVLAGFRPDVVHVRMFLTQLSPSILPLLRDVPSVYHASWYRAVCPLGTKILPDETECREPAGLPCLRHGCLPVHDWAPLMLQTALWRRWRGVFDAVVANSDACRRRLVADGLSPVQVIWNGVPVVPARPPLTGPPVVSFAGRLVRQKGVDVLLRAFALVVARVPEARLLVAGEGPERAALERLMQELGLGASVTLLGQRPRPELEAAFSQAWLQAVPSRWAESFGLVAAEAMMRGSAVVASRTGGLPEFIRDGETGRLVAPGDASALAEALLALLQERARAEAMGQQGRQVALAELDEERWLDRFVALYETLT